MVEINYFLQLRIEKEVNKVMKCLWNHLKFSLIVYLIPIPIG